MPRPAFPRTVLEFQKRFAAEEACLEYLIASRWSEGFVCPRCGSTDAWWKASRRLFECKACRYQASVTAGTVMHRSRMPLRLWFWAAYLVTTHTPGLSARQFARQLDLHYETAFQMLHKLRAARFARGARGCVAPSRWTRRISAARGPARAGGVLTARCWSLVPSRVAGRRWGVFAWASFAERRPINSSASSRPWSRKAPRSSRTRGRGTPVWGGAAISTRLSLRARQSVPRRSCRIST